MPTNPPRGNLRPETPRTSAADPPQIERFKAAARELGTDDDYERFKATVKRIAKAAPTKQADKPKVSK